MIRRKMKTALLKYTVIYFPNWINESDTYENEECLVALDTREVKNLCYKLFMFYLSNEPYVHHVAHYRLWTAIWFQIPVWSFFEY